MRLLVTIAQPTSNPQIIFIVSTTLAVETRWSISKIQEHISANCSNNYSDRQLARTSILDPIWNRHMGVSKNRTLYFRDADTQPISQLGEFKDEKQAIATNLLFFAWFSGLELMP